MKSTAPQLAIVEERRTLGWIDALFLLVLLGLLWSALHFGKGMIVHFDPAAVPEIDSSPSQIPYYAGRTLMRMWIAFGFSLFFAVATGYLAAKSRTARAFILPALDVLQSVPVLGFLSATVAAFMALFPGSLLGVECAAIFAIFTGQVWNMAFGFYHSMVTIPNDMQEAASTYGLTRAQRFRTVELPASAHSLIWNSMMSFGGGWFFVAQSEAISVMNKDIKLPGLGSYMAQAIAQGDNTAALWAVVAMIVLILVSDQLVWRPLLAWADKFKIELTESATPATSWVYNLLRGAYLFTWIGERLWLPLKDRVARVPNPAAKVPVRLTVGGQKLLWRAAGIVLAVWIGFEILKALAAAVAALHGALTLAGFGHIVWLGVLTALRVATMTVLATLIWVPVGVWIGSQPRVARFAQPLAQIGASFPVNMTFPIVVGFFVATHVTLNWGSILLIAMGTQWYILFNVIAGAMAIPNDLKEAARVYGLRDWNLWRTLILPAIFPYWVTGACTAAGGAWNASIVAELATWGSTTLKADGLGAYIATVTREGDTALIIASIGVMSIFVVLMNKLIWRRLYAFAERRFKLD
ncbi:MULTISPECIES: ABC transporter permease [Variovorax]|jgi:NitT/TauT family transport system permease protein|uniref:ABC transporter permease n=1 Tax=Variovorax TaxID=34072 RepID=UPI00086E8F24|nr:MULTISPECIES: ABC transporter permease subunit [Variovorax]MBN8752860.1 ABC transporter permease subunit [Variovorax sp.]ODU16867.1 MAG: sulfonate ABC transporter permease [Variovorax sp. SCN 67-85]ODV25689.1 MAG: sulfonate ABC transporter permease [Variovorax sp. SCN 67-20]OJZ15261.1 MAG: sulfonate ABC transporter permease [Variovorax sp. 67-131]UKI07998.1 ABC transporter permease subunit [Variovorax paradoxus]